MSGECYGELISALSRKRARDVDDDSEFGKRRQLAALYSSMIEEGERERVVDLPLFPVFGWNASESVVSEVLRVLEENPYIPECASEGDSDAEDESLPTSSLNRLGCRQLRHNCWSVLTGNARSATILRGTHEDLQVELSTILRAMQKYSSNVALLACGCHDLILMAPERPMTVHQEWARCILDYGGIRTAMNALVDFMDNHDLQDVITRLLYLLVMPGLCTRSVLIEDNPTATLLRVLQCHRSKEDLCCDIGWTLCSLMSDETNRNSFLQENGVEQFMNTMNYHFDSGRIQEPCLLALIDIFQYHDDARLHFFALGGAELLTRTLDHHGQQDDVVHAVVAVLFKVYHDMNDIQVLTSMIQSFSRLLQNDNLRAKIQQNIMHWLFHASEIANWKSAMISSEEMILSILTATSETRPALVRYHGLFLLLDISLEPACRSFILDHGGVENIMALPQVCRELSLRDPHFWQMLQRRMGNFFLSLDAEIDDLTTKAFQGGTQAMVDVLQSLIPAPP